jgi:hypothetical protein
MPGIAKSTFRRIANVIKWAERNPRNPAPQANATIRAGREDRWFYTTSAMTTATVSGTDINSARMTPGGAQARVCFWAGGSYAPDTSKNAADQPITNCTVLAASIPAGCFYKCTIVNGLWEADLSTQC